MYQIFAIDLALAQSKTHGLRQICLRFPEHWPWSKTNLSWISSALFFLFVSDFLMHIITKTAIDSKKCDITFSPPKGDDGAVGGAIGNQHAEEQVGTENKSDKL